MLTNSAAVARALAVGDNPLGPDPDFHPASQYWQPDDWDDVPLRAWAGAKGA